MESDQNQLQEPQPTLSQSLSSFYYYNPYEKRTIVSPLNNIDAFISLLKCVMGTGILAMPLAFNHSGIVSGVVFCVLLMIFLTYCIHLLIAGMTECCRRTKVPLVSMPEAVYIAYQLGPEFLRCFAKSAEISTSCVLVVGQFGLCCIYIVFVAQNLKEIGDHYWNNYNERYYIVAICLIQLPIFLIRKLKYLVPLNLISNLLLYIGFICIMYYLFRGLPNVEDRAYSKPPMEWLHFFGIAAFSLTAVGSMLVVEANMKHPENYLGIFGVLNMAVLFILFSNVFFGVMGYWRFGDQVAASITLNIPANEIISQIIKIAIAGGIFFSYPLNGFVVITVIFNDYGSDPSREYSNNYEIFIRICFLLLTGVVAAVIPDLEALTGLEGAFSLSNLNLICPAMIDLCLNYVTGYGTMRWKLIRDITIIIMGIIFGCVGCTVAIQKIIADFKDFK